MTYVKHEACCLSSAAKDGAGSFLKAKMTVRLLQVQDVITVMDEELRSAACDVAMQLRQAGRIVDLILEGKKMKQVFKVSAKRRAKCL